MVTGENTSGVFRPIVPILRKLIEQAGGKSAIMVPKEEYRNEYRIFSSAINSNAMLDY